jgi:hypothetical protein
MSRISLELPIFGEISTEKTSDSVDFDPFWVLIAFIAGVIAKVLVS